VCNVNVMNLIESDWGFHSPRSMLSYLPIPDTTAVPWLIARVIILYLDLQQENLSEPTVPHGLLISEGYSQGTNQWDGPGATGTD